MARLNREGKAKQMQRGSFQRRAILAAGGGLIAALGARNAVAQPSISESILTQWNIADTVRLWPENAPNGGFQTQSIPDDMPSFFIRNVENPYMRVFRPKKSNGRSLLAIPGGAYTFVSIANEGVDLANAMTAQGYTVFVLVYRLPGEGWSDRKDVPLQDAQRAIRLIKASAAQFGCDPEQVYAVGFSAGGHLAATLAASFAEQTYPAFDAADRLSARPRAVGLIYPVISHASGIGHAESTLRLLGSNPPMLDVVNRSPDLHVGEDTPPMFLLHAMDDPAVAVENSLIMMGAMRAARRPVEAHLFEKGGHGFGLGKSELPVSEWPSLFAAWMNSHAG